MAEEDYPFEDGEFEELIKKYETARDDGGSRFFDVEEFLELCEHYAMFGDFVTAFQVIEMAISQHPQSQEILLQKARVSYRSGRYADALKLLERLELSDPKNVEIHLLKAELHSENQDYEKSISHFLKAIEYSEGEEKIYLYIDLASEYQNKGDLDRARFYYRKAILGAPFNDLGYLEYYFLLQMENNMSDGIEFLKKVTDSHPYNAIAWYYLGLCYQEEDLLEDAINSLDFATIIDEEYGDAYIQKAECFMDLEHYRKAIDTLTEAEACFENLPRLHYMKGECYEQLEMWSEGFASYQLATRSFPEMAESWIGMAICLSEMGNSKEALAYTEHALKMEPENPHYQLVRASILRKLGKFGEAESVYRRLCSSHPHLIEIFNEACQLYMQLDDPLSAAELLKEGLAYNPEESELLYLYAGVLLHTGRRQEGINYLILALDLNFSGHKELFTFIPDLVEDSLLQEIIQNHPEYGNKT
jgi:tetratricopeptide (TPR) repeat protein